MPALTLRPSGVQQRRRTESPTGEPAIEFFTHGVDGQPPTVTVTVVLLARDMAFTTAPDVHAAITIASDKVATTGRVVRPFMCPPSGAGPAIRAPPRGTRFAHTDSLPPGEWGT